MDKDPETRYQHIDELLSDLRREKKESGEHKVEKRSTKKSKTKIAVIISAVALVALGAALIIYLLTSPTKKVKPPKHTQLTFDGNIYFLENGPKFDRSHISPDGQFTAYVVDNEEERSIYVKDNSGERAIEIFKGLRDVSSLRWSPSGHAIFFSVNYANSSLASYIIPKLGGKTQQLNYIQYGCWSPDETLIAAISLNIKRIRLIKRETDEIIKTLNLNGSFSWLQDIDWSPIGDKILFLTYDHNTGNNAIWSIKPDGKQQQKILEESKSIYCPRWSADGNYIYYLQSNETTRDLMRIAVISNTATEAPKVIQTGLLAFGFSITADNRKLCYTKSNNFSNLWRFTFNERKNSFQSKKLTEGTSLFGMPNISPDGEEVVFVRNGSIFRMSIGGDSMKQITFLNSECWAPSWSPNGKEIAFISNLNLAKVSLNGGSPTIFKNTTVDAEAFWESDLEIYFHKQGNQNFYIFNLATQKSRLLVSNESVGWMFQPRVSSDNLNVVVHWNRRDVTKMARGLWIISLKDSSQKLLLKDFIFPNRWSKDRQWIYATDFNRTPAAILMVSASTGLTKLIYTLPAPKIKYGDIDISSDGKTIVCAIGETNSDVWMIENFDPDVE